MMMAPNSTPQPPEDIDPATLAGLQVALKSYLLDPGDTSSLRDPLSALAREARMKGILPERMLVTLKALWKELPAVQDATDKTELSRTLQQIVSMCVREYYGSAGNR